MSTYLVWFVLLTSNEMIWLVQQWSWSEMLLLMSGFRSVPTAICYWHDVQVGQPLLSLMFSYVLFIQTITHLWPRQSPDQPSLLFLGDEKGGIHLLRFLNPSKGLFKDSPKKELLRIFLPVGLTWSVEDPRSKRQREFQTLALTLLSDNRTCVTMVTWFPIITSPMFTSSQSTEWCLRQTPKSSWPRQKVTVPLWSLPKWP